MRSFSDAAASASTAAEPCKLHVSLRIVSNLLTNDKEGHKLVKQVAMTPPNEHEGPSLLTMQISECSA